MDRRAFIGTLGGSLLATSLATGQGKVWRVGFLSARRRPVSLETDYYGA